VLQFAVLPTESTLHECFMGFWFNSFSVPVAKEDLLEWEKFIVVVN
jgi:hypothetical protein